MSSTAIRRTVCADRGAHPAQRRAAPDVRCRLRCELVQQRLGIERGLRGAQPLLQPCDGLRQARGLDRLDEVVEHALRERLHGVLVVRGDEHQMRAATDLLRGLDAGHARACARRGNRRPAACASNCSTASRPLRACATISSSGQACASMPRQRLAQQRLVVGDQRGRPRASSCRAPARRELQFGADAVRLRPR